MLEYFGFVAGTSLANPKVSCTVTVCEIFIKWSFFLQLSHAFTQFRLIARKKNRVNDSEIKFSYLVTIGAKAVFNCYFMLLLIFIVLRLYLQFDHIGQNVVRFCQWHNIQQYVRVVSRNTV